MRNFMIILILATLGVVNSAVTSAQNLSVLDEPIIVTEQKNYQRKTTEFNVKGDSVTTVTIKKEKFVGLIKSMDMSIPSSVVDTCKKYPNKSVEIPRYFGARKFEFGPDIIPIWKSEKKNFALWSPFQGKLIKFEQLMPKEFAYETIVPFLSNLLIGIIVILVFAEYIRTKTEKGWAYVSSIIFFIVGINISLIFFDIFIETEAVKIFFSIIDSLLLACVGYIIALNHKEKIFYYSVIFGAIFVSVANAAFTKSIPIFLKTFVTFVVFALLTVIFLLIRELFIDLKRKRVSNGAI